MLTRFIDLNIFCDAAARWQLGFQDPATLCAEGMLGFHEYLMIFLILIGCFVFWFLLQIITLFSETNHKAASIFSHSSQLEILWSCLPCIIVYFIATPSFTLLYSLEEFIENICLGKWPLKVKAIGHQWYWSYEYDFSDFSHSDLSSFIPEFEYSFTLSDKLSSVNSIQFDSYMINVSENTSPAFRLLEVDNRLVLPTFRDIHLLITSTDVLHCWAVPSFGIKIDACPGRVTEAVFFIKRTGTFYGQCSEICGLNHGFMPIVVEAVTSDSFLKWLFRFKA